MRKGNHMKNKIATALISLLLVAVIGGCGNSAASNDQVNTSTEEAPAEAEAPSECEVNGHDFEDATCALPKTCKICGATEGTTLEHQWGLRTVESAKTCSVCGETEGEPISVTTLELNTKSGDSDIFVFGNGYVSYAWDNEYNNVYLSIYDNSNNLIESRHYSYDGESSAVDLKCDRINNELYLCILGMVLDDDTDIGASDNNSAIIGPNGETIWSSENWSTDYHANSCFDNGGYIAVLLWSDELWDSIVVNTETNEEVELEVQDSFNYARLSDNDKYSESSQIYTSPLILVSVKDESQWGYADEDGNELAMYADACFFSESGYSIVSDDKENYYIIDQDFNVLSEKNIEGVYATKATTFGNEFIITREDGSQYMITIE